MKNLYFSLEDKHDDKGMHAYEHLIANHAKYIAVTHRARYHCE
jgi:hypothetical protein